MSLSPSQPGCAGHWLFPCGTTPPPLLACCTAAPPDLRSSPSLLNWKTHWSSLLLVLLIFPCPDISLHLLSAGLPLSGANVPHAAAPARRHPHTAPAARHRPCLALCKILGFFAPFSFNQALIGELILVLYLRSRDWVNSPGVPHWKCLKTKSS